MHIAEALRQQAHEQGLTLNEYLAQIATGESIDQDAPSDRSSEETEVSSIEVTNDEVEVLDALDRKFSALAALPPIWGKWDKM